MCGRAACAMNPIRLQQVTKVSDSKWNGREKYSPSYNIGPGRNQPILVLDQEKKQRQLQSMTWGLVPSWSKGKADFSSQMKTINARSDNLQTSPLYSRLLNSKRCVIVVDGFFEWLRKGKDKIPYFIYNNMNQTLNEDSKFDSTESSRSPLWFAGLFDVWHNSELNSNVITVDVAKELEWLHTRMPALLLSQEEVDNWLDSSLTFDKVIHYLKPREGVLGWYQVSQDVNNIRNNLPTNVLPISEKGKITSFFQRKEEPVSNENDESFAGLDEDREQDPSLLFERYSDDENLDKSGKLLKNEINNIEETIERSAKKVNLGNDFGEEAAANDDKAFCVSEAPLQHLLSLGFVEERSRHALLMFDNDAERAANFLLG